MRHIVLEGPDNSGKSTLAQFLATRLHIPILHSGGPEREPGEINKRVRTFLDMRQMHIFDRHPCISQMIYRQISSTNQSEVDPVLIGEFYNSRPLLIYCRPLLKHLGEGHIPKSAHDTPQHLADVKAGYSKLLAMYDTWAVEKANVIYRIGDDYELIAGHVWRYKGIP